MLTKTKGISVVICSHNGANNLSATLQHLAAQRFNDYLNWEVVLIDNASSDNTAEEALKIWQTLETSVAFTVLNEPKPGKDNALELGFATAKYEYVIVCDDDNWLDKNYVQNAFEIVSSNPQIGILGGMGIAAFESTPPPWFEVYKIYYAVGSQYCLNGEVKHYWPANRFIWGAGAVINMHAYRHLKNKGFERILTFDKYPSVARSEDLELCYAIWMAGYKMWYDEKLTYQHYITNDRLKWTYLMGVAKQAVSSIHYLRAYNILIFTGHKNAPKSSFWLQYIARYWKNLAKNLRSVNDLRLLARLFMNAHIEDDNYFRKALAWYQFISVFKLGKTYDVFFERTKDLQKRLMNE